MFIACVWLHILLPFYYQNWTVNWALLWSGHLYCMYTSHTHRNDIIAVLLPRVLGCACASLHMWVRLLLCWITSDFSTRYVSLTQIWKTEYTRTQLPGPPEEPVSPGQDRTERDGNGTSEGNIHIGFVFITARRGVGGRETGTRMCGKECFVLEKGIHCHLIRWILKCEVIIFNRSSPS